MNTAFTLLLLIAAVLFLHTDIADARKETEDEKLKRLDDECEVKRDDAYKCAKDYADLDHDGRISKPEVVYFRNFVLHWWERALIWVANETPEKVMDRCAQGPEEQYITTESYENSKMRCLKHCKDWKLLTNMCDRFEAKSHREIRHHRKEFKSWLEDHQ